MHPRLYTEQELASGQSVKLTDAQLHYLWNVLRCEMAQEVSLFNGRDGEWSAKLDSKATAKTIKQKRVQKPEPDIWLVFAPVKKDATDFIIEKATELGTRQFHPVFTERTNTQRLNLDRAQANAIEASEQTERLSIPEIFDAKDLRDVMADWPADRLLMYCDEGGGIPPIATFLQKADHMGKYGILVGPEGGFSENERTYLKTLPFVRPVHLGPRILRADTAALAALTCFQALLGDWN